MKSDITKPVQTRQAVFKLLRTSFVKNSHIVGLFFLWINEVFNRKSKDSQYKVIVLCLNNIKVNISSTIRLKLCKKF